MREFTRRYSNESRYQAGKAFLPLLAASIAFLGLLILCLYFSRLPTTSGKVELLFPRQSESFSFLERERALFDDCYTDSIVLSGTDERFWEREAFVFESLEEELLSLEGVQSVIVPGQEGEGDLLNLITPDLRAIRLIVKVSTQLNDQQRKRLNDAISSVLENYASFHPRRAGSFVTMQEVAGVVSRETTRIVPWIVLTLFLVLLCFLRSLLLTVLIMGSTLLGIGTALMAYSLLGYPLGPVSQLAPPFLLAVGASFHLHLATRILATTPSERKNTLHEIRSGISFAALTTALSLLTLLFLDVADVTRFALLSSAGVLLSGLYACFLPVRFLMGSRQRQFLPKAAAFFQCITNGRVIVVLLLLVALLATGVQRLNLDTDPLLFLPDDHQALEDIRVVESVFPGNHFLGLIIFPGESGESLARNEFERLDSFEARLRSLKDVINVITPHDFERAQELRVSRDFTQEFSLREEPIPLDFYDPKSGAFRILIETSVEGQSLMQLAAQIQSLADETDSLQDSQVGIASFELIMAEQTSHITQGLIQSLGTTLGMVLLLLLFLLGSLKGALMGLIPNVVPLCAVFGLLGISLGSLDFGSCLVATSALGIAVDNTFHFLLCWRACQQQAADTTLAAPLAVERTASSFVITSTTLLSSFLVMGFARSLPVSHFGLLLSLTLAVGLLADLVILPFFLSYSKNKDKVSL